MPQWVPTPEWEGEAAYVIGGGSSLKSFDFSCLRGRHVIGCNDAFRLGPIVDVNLFGDEAWFKRNKWDFERFKGRAATCCEQLYGAPIPWLLQLKRVKEGMGLAHEGVGWNFNTGSAAINLALQLGAKRVYLLGFDMTHVNGESHWHKHAIRPVPTASYYRFMRGFSMMRKDLFKFPGAVVLNVTDGSSRLPFFKKIPFSEMPVNSPTVSINQEVAA